MLSPLKLASKGNRHPSSTSNDDSWSTKYSSLEPTNERIPYMPPSPPSSISPLRSQLFSSIGQLEQLISNCEPNDEQLEHIISQFESIASYLRAPQAQSRLPASSLFDSALGLDLEDIPSHEDLQPTPAFDDSIVSHFLPGYSSCLQDVTRELKKRLDETFELHDLCLERVRHAEAVKKAHQAQAEKLLLDLHFDYSELLSLKIQLNKIKQLASPGEDSARNFEDAVRLFELNWRDTEGRISTRLGEGITASKFTSFPEGNSDDVDERAYPDEDEDEDEDEDDFEDAVEFQPSLWDSLAEEIGLIDYYEQFGFGDAKKPG